MVMQQSRTTSYWVVSEFEGTLLKNPDPFSYFMLMAFDASGLFRFTILLFLWPVIKLLNVFSYKNAALKLMIFVATVGLHEPDVESVARAVLPKFYMDDISMDTWTVYNSCKRKVVVTRMPQIMVERFAKEQLRANEVIGTELIVNGLGFVTGFIREIDIDQSISDRVANLFVDRRPHLGLGVSAVTDSTTFLSLCEEINHAPVPANYNLHDEQLELRPAPVIFHDGRLVKRPTPASALLVLIWIPFGIVLAVIRILVGSVLPVWSLPYVTGLLGIQVTVKGKPPQTGATGNSAGLLFVCNHKTLMDPVMITAVLGRRISAISYTLSRFTEIFSPIRVVRIKRIRDDDAKKIEQELCKGDIVICPEGTISREPFLLRFSPLFAELTDKIVPVAMNCRVGFFHPSTVRGWNGLDAVFFFMNPIMFYEITFLNQLSIEATCSSGKDSPDVANYVQRILAATLGFECTNLTRKDRFRVLADKDGKESYLSFRDQAKKIVSTYNPFTH